MSPLLVLFVFGGPFFWILTLACMLTVCTLVEELLVPAGLILLTYFSVVTLLSDNSFFIHLFQWKNLFFVPVYLLVGVSWSFFKWYLFNIDRKKVADKAKYEFEKCSSNSYMDYGLDKRFYTFLTNKYKLSNLWVYDEKNNICSFKPSVSSSKERLSAWIVYWPWSILRFIFGDMIVRLKNYLFDRLQQLYQRVTDSIFDH